MLTTSAARRLTPTSPLMHGMAVWCPPPNGIVRITDANWWSTRYCAARSTLEPISMPETTSAATNVESASEDCGAQHDWRALRLPSHRAGGNRLQAAVDLVNLG